MQQDIAEYLWEMDAEMDEDTFALLKTRNYKIVKEMEPLFTEESFHKVYVANVHANQKKDGYKQEFMDALAGLEQVKSVEEDITFLWDADNMPVAGGAVYSEEQLDGAQLDGYGFVPYMINYLLEDPTAAKGNILLFSGGNRTNDLEGFPTAEVFNDLGYNCFVVNARTKPYTAADTHYDTIRALRLVKALGQENGWGGQDMTAMLGFSAGGVKVIDAIEAYDGTAAPSEEGYTPDAVDTIDAVMDVAMLLYTGLDDPLVETGHWPALFLCAGSEDGTGATQRLERYYEQTKDIVPTELIVYEGAGHGFGSGKVLDKNTTEECAGWTDAADAFMQENKGYSGSAQVNETAEAANTISIQAEQGSVTVEYYDGAEILQTEVDGNLLVQVPRDTVLDDISIYAENGEIDIIGVIAKHYDLETVHDDMNVYLPEDQAFHVQLVTISDLFESDFLYDVTMTRHEYIFGEDGVDIEMETIVGVARVMILQ